MGTHQSPLAGKPAPASVLIDVDKLLAAPEAPEHFTRINGSKLWHLALLEWWLQVHVDPLPTAP